MNQVSNKRIHSDKVKPRCFALQLYFSGDSKRYAGGAIFVRKLLSGFAYVAFPFCRAEHRRV